jgi:hypothetical protein
VVDMGDDGEITDMAEFGHGAGLGFLCGKRRPYSTERLLKPMRRFYCAF